jgi:hypothetical protein
VGFQYATDECCGSGGSSIFVDEAAEDRSPDNVRTFEFLGGVLGSWWAQLLAAVGWLRVVVADVLVHKQSRVPLAEDHHSVGEFGSHGSCESLAEAVWLPASGWDLNDVDARVGEDRVEGSGELAGPIPYEVPEPSGPIAGVS